MVDKKALIREYKEARRPMGAFRVYNKVNDKSLVGVATELPGRLNRERAQLKLNAHGNKALQKDWNELGADAFEFEILDTLAPNEELGYDPTDDLKILEQLWFEKLSPFDDRGYNARPKVR